MFTRRRWIVPIRNPDPLKAIEDLKRSIHDYLLALETPGALAIADIGETAPTVTAGSGAFTAVACALKYTYAFDRVHFNAAITITTNGTAASHVIVPLPFTPAETIALAGRDNAGNVLSAAAVSTGSAFIYTATGTYPGGDGKVLQISGSYRVA